MLDRKVRQLMQEVLEVSEPSEGLELELEPRDKAILGFLKDARRMLKGLLVLAGSDLDDTGDGLARSMFEHAATAGWLAADETNMNSLRDAYITDWSEVQESWEARHAEAFPFPNDLRDIGVEKPARKVRLPSVYHRARDAGLVPYFTAYKGLCTSIHGTLAAAAFGLNPAGRERLRDVRFAIAGAMVLHLAEKLDTILGGKPAEAIALVRDRMMKFFVPQLET
jgi:hypothetical protein